MGFKYIVGLQSPYVSATIFAEGIDHREMMRGVYKDMDHVLSAGFGFINENGEVQVYGESVGLKLHSRPEDKIHLEIALGIKQRNEDPQEFKDYRELAKRLDARS